MHIPKHVYLYDCPGARTLHVSELTDYLEKRLKGVDTELRNEFFEHHLEGRDNVLREIAERLACSKVRDIRNPEIGFEPLYGEIEYELKFLRRSESKPIGIMYDGVRFLQILWGLIPEEERNLDRVHIVLTNQLLGTYDVNDKRYHARVSVYGIPSVLSTTGVVEGPAKPKKFYLLKQQYTAVGREGDIFQLKEQFRGAFIDHDDERLTEILKGYVMQAFVYHMTGTPFCEDPNCRLYNAHWQKEMIHAQLESPYEFCQTHMNLLQGLNEPTGVNWEHHNS